MGIGVWDHHVELASTVQRWTATRGLRAEARRFLETDDEELPSSWSEMADLGWFGLAVSEARGGQGAGVLEAAVVLEELGAVCAPGPILPTVVVAAALDRWGERPDRTRGLVEGVASAVSPPAATSGRRTATAACTSRGRARRSGAARSPTISWSR